MRDFQLPGRSPVHGTEGMAATSHPLATLAAVDMLRAGGNAMDAAIAAAAVQAVVEPQSTGIGGDCFVLYAPAGSGEVIAYNGSGRAPKAAETDWYRERGFAEIPSNSAHAVTVPGAIDAWDSLAADHGRKGFDALLQAAIHYAETGYVVHGRVAADWAACVELLRGDEAAARIFLPGGAAPKAGSLHRQPELAATLKAIARQGRAGFYEGAVAEDIVGHLRRQGGLHALDDFAEARGEYVAPISSAYRGIDIHQVPPNNQGITALIMLNILSGFDLARLDPRGAERLHLEVEAARLAFRDRDALIADPRQAEISVAELLSADYAAALRRHIDPNRAATDLPPALLRRSDTVYLCVVDRDCNAVSFINSLFDSFGSGLVGPRTGVVLHNRGTAFRVDPVHPNCIAPGRRPLHTIMPGLAVKNGRAVMPFGVMGGDYQPFGHVHFLTNVLDFGCDLQEALDMPRVFYDQGVLAVERGIDAEAIRGLTARGHRVAVAAKPLGGGQAISIDWETGVLTGGSDPRKDGCALGY